MQGKEACLLFGLIAIVCVCLLAGHVKGSSSTANLWSSPHGFQATGSVGTSKVDRSASGKPDRSGGEVIGTIGLSSINPQPSYQAATSTLTIAPSPTASSVMLHPSGLDSFTTAASHLQHETQTPGFIYRSLQTTVLFTAPAIASKTRGEIHNESLTVSPSASLWQGTRSIVLTSGSEISCDFDESMCGFVNDRNDTFDWTRHKGSTLSHYTGPFDDHTGKGGYYMYIEASSPRLHGDIAKLNSPLLIFSGTMCLKFFYHMYGDTVNSLRVIINSTRTVFRRSGDKGPKWFEAGVTTSLSGMYMVTFEGIIGSSFTGDIAIDDFSLISGTCLPIPYCNFDESMCGFVQDKNDTFDWTRYKGSTPSFSTGPTADHTGYGGYYMYIETSRPRVQGDNAKLNSPLFKFGGKMCIHFFYHMYGETTGRLNVIVNGTITLGTAYGDLGNEWREARQNVSLSGMYMITFEGIAGGGFKGDIAIDDFSLTSGYCPPVLNPCENYNVLNTSDRFVGFMGQTSVTRCDQTDLSIGWYRFTGAAGDMMQTTCPEINHCGTDFPGWMTGSHPTVAEGVVTRKVCYHGRSGCCIWYNNIKVKNCGFFYVYELQKTPLCPLRYCGAASECLNYTALNQGDRAVSNKDQTNVKCDGQKPDNIASPGWYRMTGNSGDRIPESCVPERRCGTHAPGWLNGTHPAVKDGVVTRQVCYHSSGSCCKWKNDIKIRNCSGFYVYELVKPPSCYLRYCGNKQVFGPCTEYNTLNTSDRFVGFTGQTSTKCDQKDFIVGWYRFTGAAGDRMASTCPKMHHCSTDAPGWMSGTHPTVEEGIVTRKVCYHWTSGCCQWSNYLRVKNCGAFYVYELQKTPLCSISSRYCGDASECINYKALNQSDRALGNADQSNVKCDRREPDSIVSGWYRMTGDSGDQIPESCVPERRCGTSAPGWLNGTHPAVEEGVVIQRVCYHWSGRCCNWENTIKIRNCGDYFVYYLINPPDCSLRYCGNKDRGQCREPCTNGRKCRQLGIFLCLCERGKRGTNCQEEDVLKKVVVFSLTIQSEVWKPEYSNLKNPVTQEFVDRLKKAVVEEIGIGSFIKDVTIESLREGSIMADIHMTFNESVGENEVDALLKETTKDGQFGQFRVDQARIHPVPDVSSADPTQPGKMNKAIIYGPVIAVLTVASLSFFVYRLLLKKRLNCRRNEEDTRRNERGAWEPPQNAPVQIEMTSGYNNNGYSNGSMQHLKLSIQSPTGEESNTDDATPDYLVLDENDMLEAAHRSWEISREQVTVEKVIGKGAFGQVAQGTVFSLQGEKETITVAIKMLKGDALESDKKDLLSELQVMKTLKPHPHVIKLLACVTKSDPLMVIIEYVPFGDLLGYLRKSRGLDDTYYNHLDAKPHTNLTSQQLMKMAWQIADGMSYLSSRNIIHRDLAARNVLVGEKEICKVTDFGMARDVEHENIYEKKSEAKLPVKWTAREALFYGQYTAKSDVWSYGVVLYEVFTIGGTPYPGIPARNVGNLLLQGYRMPKPNHVSEALYKIMLKCWQDNPDDRPMFESLRDELRAMENQHKKMIKIEEYEERLYDYFEDLVI